MEEREQLTQLTSCQNPVCAMEKKVLEGMLQTRRIECQGNCAMELKELKEEMAKLKRDMHDLVLKKKKEKEKLIVISPSYSVRSLNVDKEEAYRTLMDKTRIMEEQLTDILRSLEETDTPNRHVPAEEQHLLAKSPRMEGVSVSEDQNLVQMQETEPEGQNGTHEQEHIAEAPRFVLDEFPAVVKESMAPITVPCREVGSALGVTDQENQEQLQLSEVREHEQMEVMSDTVELAHDCEGENGGSFGTEDEQPQVLNSEQPDLQVVQLESVELPNPEKSPQQDLQVQQDSEMGKALVCVELPYPEKSPQHDLQVEQDSEVEKALVCVELPNPEKSPQQDIRVEQDSEMEKVLVCVELPNPAKSPQQDIQVELDSEMEKALVCVELPQHDLHIEDIVSNPLCLPMNMECFLNDRYLPLCNVRPSLGYGESMVGTEVAPVDVQKGPLIEQQEQANQLNGETEAHPYQLTEEAHQSGDPVQRQLTEVETPKKQKLSEPELPELPCPGQPEEVRILKMVEELVLQQQQSSGYSLRKVVVGQPARTESPRKRLTPKIRANAKEKPQKGSSTKKASKAKSNSDTASITPSLEEQQQPSEGRRRTKRKLDELWTPEKEQKQGKQKGRPKKTKPDKKPKNQKQPKGHDEPRRLVSDMTVKTVLPLDDDDDDEKQDEDGASHGASPKQNSSVSLASQEEQQDASHGASPKQNSSVSLVSQEEQQDTSHGGSPKQNSSVSLVSQEEQQEASKPEEPDSEAAVKTVLPSASDDQGLGEQQCSNKPAKLNAGVVTEWLARQGMLEGRKRPGKA